MSANMNVVVKLHSDVLQWKIEGATLETANDHYTFSHIFSKNSTNECINDVIACPLLSAVLDGYDGTIITCGQPKSGKTHAIIGNDLNHGIISLAMNSLYKEMKLNFNKQYLLRFSLIEIVDEKLFDLLNDKIELGIVDNEISGAKEKLMCDKKAFVIDIKKAFAAQSLNSSVIIKLIIESQEDNVCVSIGCLTVMKVASTARCMESLDSAVRKRGNNYVLTTLLNSSLGGGTNTAIICTINTSDNAEQILNLMANAKLITNVPVRRNLNPSNSKLFNLKNWWSQKTKGVHRSNVSDYNQEGNLIFNIDVNYIPLYIINWTSQSKNTSLLETDLDNSDIMLKDEILSLINDDISSVLVEDIEKTSDSSTDTILNDDKEIGWLIHGKQTPKSVLRQRANYYKEEYLSLCEHTKLEKTLELQSSETSMKIPEASDYDSLGVIGKLSNSDNLFFVPELEVVQGINKLDVINEEDESLLDDLKSVSNDEIILMKLFKYMPSIMENVDFIKSEISSNESLDNTIEFVKSLSEQLNELTNDPLPDDMKVDLDSLNVLTTTTSILLDYERSMSEKIAKTNSIIKKFDQLKSKNESFRVLMREKDKEIEQLSDEIMQYVEKLSSCETKLFNVENLRKMDSEGIKHITEYLEKVQHSLLGQMLNVTQKFNDMFFKVNEKIILYEEKINKIKNDNVTLKNQLNNDQKIKEQNYNIKQNETDAENAELKENLSKMSLELSKKQSENNELQKLIDLLMNKNEIDSHKCKVVQQDVNISLDLLNEHNMISELQSDNHLQQEVNTQTIQVSSVSQSNEHCDCNELAIKSSKVFKDEEKRLLDKIELLTIEMCSNKVKYEENISHLEIEQLKLQTLHDKLKKQTEMNEELNLDWNSRQKNYEERLVELQQIIETFTGDCKTYESENVILRKQVDELTIKMNKLLENNIALQANYDKIELYKERYEGLLDQYNVCDKNAQDNIKTINQLNSEIVEISKELELFKNLNEMSNSSNYEAKCNEQQQKLNLMESTSEKQIEKIKELQEDLIALKDENRTFKQLCTELGASVEVLPKLENEKKTLEQNLKIEQLKLNSLREENNANKQKYQDLLTKLTEVNGLLSTFKTENEDLQVKLEAFKEKQTELDNLRIEQNKNIINLELIETNLAATNAEKDELKNKLVIMSSEKDHLENIQSTLEQELNQLNEKLNSLIESNNSLNKIRVENDILQQKNDTLLSELEKIKQDHEASKMIESEKHKIEFDQQQCQFNTIINNLKQQLSKNLFADNAILNQEMEILRDKLYNMKCSYESLDSKYKTLEQKYQQIEAENVSLQNQVDEGLAEKDHVQTEKKLLREECSESIRKFEKINLELKQEYKSLCEKFDALSFEKTKEIKELESKLADLSKNTACVTKNNATSEMKLVNGLNSLEVIYSKIQEVCDAGCKELEMLQNDLNNWKNVAGPTHVLEDITNQQQNLKSCDNVHNEVKMILMNNNNNLFHDELYLWITFQLSDNWNSSKSFQRKDNEMMFNHILLCQDTKVVVRNNNGVINSLRFKLNKLHQLGMPSTQIQTEIDDCKAYVRKQIKDYSSIEFTVKERIIRIKKFKLAVEWVQSNLPTDLSNGASQNYHSEVNAIMDLQENLSCLYKSHLSQWSTIGDSPETAIMEINNLKSRMQMEKNSQENEFRSTLFKINSDKTNLHGKIKEMNAEIAKLQGLLNSEIRINDALRGDCDEMKTRYSDLELQKKDLHLLNVSLKNQVADKISEIDGLNFKLIEAQKQKQYLIEQLSESQEVIEDVNKKYQCAKTHIEELRMNENHKEKSTEKRETRKSLQNSPDCDETSPRSRKSEEFKITNKNRRYHLHDSLRPLVSAQATASNVCSTSEQTGFKKQFVDKEIQVELMKSPKDSEEINTLKKELEKEKMDCKLVKNLCRQRRARILELEKKYET